MLKSASKQKEQAVSLRNFFHALAGAEHNAKLAVQVNSGDAVAAHGTITLASFVATNTITVGSQTFTCESSGASGNNQFNVGGSDTLTAAAAVVAINAHPTLSPYILATSALAVITITSLVPGDIGNSIKIAVSAHGTVTGSGLLTSGANATTYSTSNTYHYGV